MQDTGAILGISQAPETVSFAAMSTLQQQLVTVIRQDPAVENLTSFIGADGVNTTMNSGRIQITLKPLDDRAGVSAVEVIRRLQPKLAQVAGIELFLQPVQDLAVEDRISRTQYQYALDAPDKALLDTWVPRLVEQMKRSAPSCATSPAISRTTAWACRSTSIATPRAGSASRRRTSTTPCTTRSASGRSRRSTRRRISSTSFSRWRRAISRTRAR